MHIHEYTLAEWMGDVLVYTLKNLTSRHRVVASTMRGRLIEYF